MPHIPGVTLEKGKSLPDHHHLLLPPPPPLLLCLPSFLFVVMETISKTITS